MFKKLTIGKRITIGFALVMICMAALGVISYRGVESLVTDVNTVKNCTNLRDGLRQREIDHLNWANQVTALLTDENVCKLDVQTDPTKCAFGEWLHSDDRKQAETLIPAIAPQLKVIVEYHAKLHESAIAIGKHFKQADALLPGKLCAREVDHLDWVDHVQDLFLKNEAQLEVQTDPHKCAFGKWLESEEARHLAATDPEFAQLLNNIIEPHNHLHASAVAMQETWKQRHLGLRTLLTTRLDDHRKWTATVCRACALQDPNFHVETDPTKCAFGSFIASEQCRHWCEVFPGIQNRDRCLSGSARKAASIGHQY